MKSDNKIGGLSKFVLMLAALFLASNIFLSIWKIQLYAPQYPEGLVLLIYAENEKGTK